MDLLLFWCTLLIIVLAYMSAWYIAARLSGRSDLVDSAWGLGFVLVAWVSLVLETNYGLVQILSAVLVSLWGLRLFVHIARRNWRRHEDDHRYQAMREKWGRSANVKLYTNVFLLQGVLVLLISTPMVAIALSAERHVNAGVIAGSIIWLTGIFFEAAADHQLAHFIAHRPGGSHAVMQSGLWRYSRHPNYFGEVTTWWGAAIVAVSVGGWWGVLGAVTITLLITKISGIPPLEKHYADNPEYTDYKKRTSVLVPLPSRSN